MEVGDTISHFNLITLYMIGRVTRHMLPHLSTGHGVFHLQVNRPLGYPEYSWISSGAINLYLFGQGNLRLLEITRASVLFSRKFYMLLNVFKSEHFQYSFPTTFSNPKILGFLFSKKELNLGSEMRKINLRKSYGIQ